MTENAIKSRRVKIFNPLRSYFCQLILVFLAYSVTGYFGLTLDAISRFATLVWPPSGIALAALLLGGYRLWPAIFVGAFTLNYNHGASLLTACGIAFGNTIEPLIGTFFITRNNNMDLSLNRLRDVARLIIFAVIISTVFSATIGVTTLWLSGVTSFEGFLVTWRAWWMGDGLGILITTPIILVLSRKIEIKITFWRFLETLGLSSLIISIVLVTFSVLGKDLGTTTFALPYLFFPCVIWAAFRFDQIGNVITLFFITTIAIFGTGQNIGPFAHKSLRGSLFLLDSFISIIAVTGLTLAAAVAERKSAIGDLKRTEAQLKEAIRDRDEFLSIASHELKTPLTSLSLQLQLAERSINAENTAPLPQKFIHVLDVSKKQVNRLTNLVEDLLDTSRIQTGRLNFVFEKMDLSILVKDMTERSLDLFKKAQCSVELDIQDHVLIEGDYARLEQVMDNLISNALKYAPGSIIKVILNSYEGRAHLVIEDNGQGIPKAKQHKLFDRYERATASRNISGLGLGLFIVKEIVKAHQGSVILESDIGCGTKIIIDLPIYSV